MGDFGHVGIISGGVCLDAWGSGPFVIAVGSREWRFEDSDQFGPALIKKNGDLLENPYPGERSPFWRAHRIWRRQGRRVGEDGIRCIWAEPKPTIIKKMHGRNYEIIDHGEDDGEYIEVKP